MALTITKNGSTVIDAKNKTVKISSELGYKGSTLTFKTEDDVAEWDDLVVDQDGTTIFAGVIEKIKITSTGSLIERQITSTGYKRLFDRKKIAERYENMTAGDIVKDIISDWTEDFTEGTIQDGSTFEDVAFNYICPSDAISQIAARIGFTWWINPDKSVDFKLRTTDSAPQAISDTSGNFRSLILQPEVSELTNSVIVRGGTYLSTVQSFETKGDGAMTQFILPEKPSNTVVKVNGTTKTLGIKLGEETPTTDFVLNYAEKYIENGTHAVLSSSDTLRVEYKFKVPLRIRKRNLSSIAAMAALFPNTDGVFEKVIEDDTLDSRDLAKEVADEHLSLFSNATIKGSFRTYESGFEPGQVVSISAKGITNTAVIEKVVAQSLGNGFMEYRINFATVLFDFEDFLRGLLLRGKLELNDGEVVESIENITDGIQFSETIKVTIDENRQLDEMEFSESLHTALNFAVSYVYGDYYPTSHTDTKRPFVLDLSPMS